MRSADAVHLEGFTDWLDLSGALLHGLSHAFTNRIASLGSYVELMKYGDAEFTPQIFLPLEISRFQAVNMAMRTLVPRDEVPSAVELSSVVRDSIALYSHHGLSYAQQLELEVSGTELPVRIAPSEVARLVLLLIHQSATHHRDLGEARVLFRQECTELAVELHFAGAQSISSYMSAVAAQSGAMVTKTPDGISVALPTVLALRARATEPRGFETGR